MSRKTIIVTGGNGGFGFLLSKYLCADGHDVILACRDTSKGDNCVKQIKSAQSDAQVAMLKLDLASLKSIRGFAKEFEDLNKPLDVLVNNAGLVMSSSNERSFTEDKFEMTIGTNHLGPFLLTNLLVEKLKSRASEVGEARIVNVTSTLHDRLVKGGRSENSKEFDINNIFYSTPGTYEYMQAYKDSKLANVYFTYELARSLEGSGVTVNAVGPGFVPSTGLMRNQSRAVRFMFRYTIGPMLRLKGSAVTEEVGAQRIKKMVDDESLKGVTGKYYKENVEAKSSEESYNEETQKALWELSARYCHMDGYEPLEP